MSTATLDVLIWVLIYGGLLVVSLGIFVLRDSAELGWSLIGIGALAAMAGAVLIVVRSRMREPETQKQDPPR